MKASFHIFLLVISVMCAICISPAMALTGTGTADDPFLAGTAAELHEALTSIYVGGYTTITADIDMTGYTWIPVGSATTMWTGDLNGGGHTISNMAISLGEEGNGGMFGVITHDANIHDLNFVSCDISAKENVGCVAGKIVMSNSSHSMAYITNVRTDQCSISATSGGSAGGIVGRCETYAYCTCNKCVVSNGDIVASGNYVGGIAGAGATNNSSSTMTECNVTNCVISSSGTNVGGIAGYGAISNSSSTMTECNVTNCVISPSGINVGGIAGVGASTNSSSTMTECNVTNCVISSSGNNVGGIAGYGAASTSSSTANDCHVVHTTVKGSSYVGGVWGCMYVSATSGEIDGCTVVNCTVKGNSQTGGVCPNFARA